MPSIPFDSFTISAMRINEQSLRDMASVKTRQTAWSSIFPAHLSRRSQNTGQLISSCGGNESFHMPPYHFDPTRTHAVCMEKSARRKYPAPTNVPTDLCEGTKERAIRSRSSCANVALVKMGVHITISPHMSTTLTESSSS